MSLTDQLLTLLTFVQELLHILQEAQNHHLTLIQDHSHQLHLKQLFQIRQSFLIMIIIWEELTDYISIKMVHLN